MKQSQAMKVMGTLHHVFETTLVTVRFGRVYYNAARDAQTVLDFIETYLPIGTSCALEELICKKHGWVDLRKD